MTYLIKDHEQCKDNVCAHLHEEEFERLAEIYKLFGNVARLKILSRLFDGECQASELASYANLSPSATSHQLKDMKHARIIKSRKEGIQVHYCLDDEHIYTLLKVAVAHIRSEHCHE